MLDAFDFEEQALNAQLENGDITVEEYDHELRELCLDFEPANETEGRSIRGSPFENRKGK